MKSSGSAFPRALGTPAPDRHPDRRARLPLFFLMLGGTVTAATCLFSLGHLDDRSIVRVSVPGFLLGFGLLLAFAMIRHPGMRGGRETWRSSAARRPRP